MQNTKIIKEVKKKKSSLSLDMCQPSKITFKTIDTQWRILIDIKSRESTVLKRRLHTKNNENKKLSLWLALELEFWQSFNSFNSR
jgi:hypothetical protein